MGGIRNVIVILHRWVGLILGLLIAVIGISGTLIVFEDEIEVAMAPELFRVEPGEAFAPITAIADAGRAAAPDRSLRYILRPNDDPRTTFQVFMGQRGALDLQVFVNPYTADVLGARTADTWIQDIHRLHGELLAGPTGEMFVGALALILCFALIGGLILWWPTRGYVARAFKIKWDGGMRRLLQDLHNTCGVYMFVFLFLTSLTALPLIWPDQTKSVLSVVAGNPELKPRKKSVPTPDGSRVSLQQVYDTGMSAVPGNYLNLLLMAFGPEGFYMVRTMPEGTTKLSGSKTVFVDQYSGTIIEISNPSQQHIVDTLAGDFSGTLHNGSIAGMPGRVLIFVAGLAFPLLFGTGLTLWLRRKLRRAE